MTTYAIYVNWEETRHGHPCALRGKIVSSTGQHMQVYWVQSKTILFQ